MASSLFPKHSQPQPTNQFNGFEQQIINKFPGFQTFLMNNMGKTPQQVAKENNLDFNQLQPGFNNFISKLGAKNG